MTMRQGTSFQSSEVVNLYPLRPPYPQQLYDLILQAAPKRDQLLDLGCGAGKMARPLADHFTDVTAIDPSQEMLRLARSLPGGTSANLSWVQGYAETSPLPVGCDVVVAALSLHWMDHASLFPRLANHVAETHILAVIQGDEPEEPPWQDDWINFLEKWLPIATGAHYQDPKDSRFWDNYQSHVRVVETHKLLSDPFKQSVTDFILCQHSRDSFAISKLGNQRDQFDHDLRAILQPYADAADRLHFRTSSTVTFCKIPAV